MSNGRLELRRAALAVCAFALTAATAGVCLGQSPSVKDAPGQHACPQSRDLPCQGWQRQLIAGRHPKRPESQVRPDCQRFHLPRAPTIPRRLQSQEPLPEEGGGVATRPLKSETPRESSLRPGTGAHSRRGLRRAPRTTRQSTLYGCRQGRADW